MDHVFGAFPLTLGRVPDGSYFLYYPMMVKFIN